MKLIKRTILLIILFVFAYHSSLAVELGDFSNEIKKYSNEYFPELNDENIVDNITNLKSSINPKNLITKIFKSITGEFRNNIALLFKIVGISILCVILKSIQSNFGDTGISEIAFYTCYLLIIILIMTSFTNIVELCKNTIHTLSEFMEFIIPIIISFLIVTGKVTVVTMLQPILLAMISVITILLTNIIMPIIFISSVINIISNISEHVNTKKLSDFLKKCALWSIEIILVLFAGVLSLEGTLAANVDGLAAKTTKSVVSNAIPVVGKLLGDTVESVLGGINLTKSAVGVVGVIVIIAITIVPLIRGLILMCTFNLASAIIEPIADGRIVKCMSGMGESIKIVFAIMATTTFLFIISISLMIKMTNI